MAELAAATSYAQDSVTTYYSKKLKNFVVFPVGDGRYRCQGVLVLSDAQYFAHMSQKSPATGERLRNTLARRLVGRAFAALTLALEVYNRPTLRNRVESFAILIVNAWELLLKAELVEHNGENAVYYPESNRSLSLRDVLKRAFADNDPVRMNLEQVESIRDDAIHLLIPELQPHFARLFQASVLNFVERALAKTGRHPLDGESPGLLSLVLDGPPVDLAVIRTEYGETTAQRVERFVHEFERQERDVANQSFAVSVEYKLVLTKHAGEADLALTTGPQGTHTALVVHQPKDIEVLFPLRSKDVLARLKTELPDIAINAHSFQAIVFKHKIKANTQLHYRVDVANMSLFSEKVIEFIVQRARQPEWLKDSRDSYAQHLLKIRGVRKRGQAG